METMDDNKLEDVFQPITIIKEETSGDEEKPTMQRRGTRKRFKKMKRDDDDDDDADEDYTPRKIKKEKKVKKSAASSSSASPSGNNNAKKFETRTKQNQKAYSWTCRICYDTFKSRKEMFEHRKEHEIEEKDTGEVLSYTYDGEHDIYVCNNCSAECQTIGEIEKHLEIHEEKFMCPVCNLGIFGPLNYSKHVQEHREDKLFPCPWCQHTSIKREAMTVHINRTHLKMYDFQCTTCGKCFHDALSFKEHENVHLGVKPFICVVCNKQFFYSRYLLSHQARNHTVRVYDRESKTHCSLCPKIFARADTLEKHYEKKHFHVRTGPYEKKHLCDVCGQGFSRPEKMKIHYRKHTGEKPYSCVYCSKSFIKKDYLTMHERIHSGEKPYVCTICGKCFNQGAPLRIHIRSHTGERPYICPYCSTGCVSKAALNSHMKSCMNTSSG